MARFNIHSGKVPFALFPEHAPLRDRLAALASPHAGSRCLVVPAPTGAGKTAMLDWLKSQSIPGVVCNYVTFNSTLALVESLHAAVFADIHEPDDAALDVETARQSNEVGDLIEHIAAGISERGITLIALDNCDPLVHHTQHPAVVRSTASVLRMLCRRCNVRFALFGAPDVVGFAEHRIADAADRIGIGPVGDSATYRQWLANLQDVHDSRGGREERLADDHIARLLLTLGRGFVGYIEQDARDAIDDGWHLLESDRHGPRPEGVLDRLLLPKNADRFGGQDLVDRIANEWEQLRYG